MEKSTPYNYVSYSHIICFKKYQCKLKHFNFQKQNMFLKMIFSSYKFSILCHNLKKVMRKCNNETQQFFLLCLNNLNFWLCARQTYEQTNGLYSYRHVMLSFKVGV